MQNLEPESLDCTNCGSTFEDVVRTGIQKNKSGLVQRYQCKKCGYRFNNREGFTKLKNNPALIIVATDLYLRGLSTREIERHMQDVYGRNVDHVTIYRWTTRYLTILAGIEETLVAKKMIHVGDRWHADETVIKIAGRKAYVWSVLDYRTRYLLATLVSRVRSGKIANKVIKLAIRRFRTVPKQIVSDGLSSYVKPIKGLSRFDDDTKTTENVQHVAGKSFKDKTNNNVIERYNRTLRRRIRVAEKFDRISSAATFTSGFQAYYNLLRPNIGLHNRTPAVKARLAKDVSLRRLLSQQMRKS
jgi:transposase-like protein